VLRTGKLAFAAAGLLAAGVLGNATANASIAAGPKPPKPLISNLHGTPGTVSSGGTTIVTASVSSATQCTLASPASKPVAGLPATFSCEGGNANRVLVMPADTTKAAKKYTLTLTATGPGGKAKAKTTVIVKPAGEGSAIGQRVAAGVVHSCAVLTSGHVSCWGGTPGNGYSQNVSEPREVQDMSSAVQLAAGEYHSCALLVTGHVQCWGQGGNGQLGDGSFSESLLPVDVQGISNAVQIAAGRVHSCAVLATGHVMCWGSNLNNQLGQETVKKTWDEPIEAIGVENATQVAAGGGHSCALLATGHVMCWGSNTDGQLGNSAAGEISAVPVEVTGIGNATQIAAGVAHTCALLATHHVECWGWNANGQLGNGTNATSHVPVAVTQVTTATQVVTAKESSCALLASGHAQCWGRDQFGQLGDGTNNETYVPVDVLGLTNAVQLASTHWHACALLATEHIECWGWNPYGQLGNGTTSSATSGSPVPVEVIGTF